MAKKLLDYDDRLGAQETSLNAAERQARQVIDGPAYGLIDYEARDFFPYATPQDIARILIDMQDKELDRDIRIINNSISFMATTIELIETHRAYRNELGKIPPAKTLSAIGDDNSGFVNLMNKTLSAHEDLFGQYKGSILHDKEKIRNRLHELGDSYFRAASETSPPKAAGLPLSFQIQRMHDLRAACGNLLIQNNEIKLSMLHSEIDFIAVLRKSMDEGIIPPSPERLDIVQDYTERVHGHTIMVHENISILRNYFGELSKSGTYDADKGKFVARKRKDMSILPLIEYMP